MRDTKAAVVWKHIVIQIIRSSKSVADAKLALIERFGLSDAQAQAIVDMRLRALTGLEREKLEKEYRELMELIKELKAILADEKLLLGVIKEEILIIATKYGDDRRTSIGIDMDDDITVEDLIPKENVVIAMTKLGYVKRMTINNFKSQNRGGKGIKGMQTIEDDFIENLFMTTTHHYIMFFTNQGRVYRLKTYEIPESGRTARGTAIVDDNADANGTLQILRVHVRSENTAAPGCADSLPFPHRGYHHSCCA